MPEYIEREAVLDLIGNKMRDDECFDEYSDGQYSGLDTAFGLVEAVPAADVAPVVHGRWVKPTKIGHRAFDIPHCSACDGVPCGVDENTKYCPNCGARMDGDK